jgi:hypothetical protein
MAVVNGLILDDNIAVTKNYVRHRQKFNYQLNHAVYRRPHDRTLSAAVLGYWAFDAEQLEPALMSF